MKYPKEFLDAIKELQQDGKIKEIKKDTYKLTDKPRVTPTGISLISCKDPKPLKEK